ncbi:MAG: rhamnulokinase family protein [Clostridiales bacterium]|nr:rhamnulokinase family protein [Clostridiales bacterium]
MSGHYFLAIDLGAESGRAILGKLENEKIETKEVRRFANAPIQVCGHLHWNVYSLFEEIKEAMRSCRTDSGIRPESVAVSTWGVDFGLLASNGTLLGLPFAYRDKRTGGAMEEFFKRVPQEQVYALTGVQFMPFNTLFQLSSMARDKSPLLDHASDLLFMPDLFTYFLTGEKTGEFTIASTSQLLDPRSRAWSEDLLVTLGLRPGLMQDVLMPGTVIGSLSTEVAEETGLEGTLVVATAGHDTAAAIAAVPAEGNDWAYISSGTWSLLGVEMDEPLITKESMELNFTNEGGVAGTIRFLKNITGLWLIRQCRKEWSIREELSYDKITRLAENAPSFYAMIDPDWPGFLNPPSMTEAIRQYCLKTGQAPPFLPGQTARLILESLALKYRFILEQLRRSTGLTIEKLHVIGGGSRNRLLCQFTADATGLPVIAGPAEATATGNIMVQALALGYVRSLADIRKIIENSVELRTYEPTSGREWGSAYERFQNVIR